ncbi:MAG: CHAT domain-containing tetratricopeptide repeat protein [Saprospiraceae bacterium]
MKIRTQTSTTLALCIWAVCLFGQNEDKQAIAHQVDSLAKEADKASRKGNLEMALSLLDAADTLALTNFGDQSQEYALCLFRRGTSLFYTNNFNQAIAWLEKAETLYAKAADPMAKNRSNCFNLLGFSYIEVGNFAAAETAYLHALEITKHLYGEKSIQHTNFRCNLRNLFIDMGRFDEAIVMSKEILTFRERLVGKMHPAYASDLNALGIIYATIGRYEEAEPILITAATTIEKTIGTDNEDYAKTLSSLANIYGETSRYVESEAMNLKLKEIIEKALGTESPFYANILNNLGEICSTQQRYEEATSYLLQTVSLREKLFGREHISCVSAELNLSSVYLETGRLEEAEPLILNARDVYAKIEGKQSLSYAACRGTEANLYMELNRYEDAGPLYEEAISIFEHNKATQHPNFFQTLDSYAKWQFKTGRTGAAVETNKRKLKMLEEAATKAATFMSEQELSQYVRSFSEAGDIVFSCLSALPMHRESLTPICYDNALFQKGFLQSAVGQVRRLATRDSASIKLFNQLTGFRRQLAKQFSLAVNERNNDLISQLESDAEKAEKSLAHNVAGYGEAVRQVAWQEVQAALQPGEAAVEFVHFKITYPVKTDIEQYAALVLRPGDAQPVFIPLFEEKQLNDLLQKRKNRRSDYVNDLYGGTSTQLYDLVWRNLETALQGVKTIYYAPSGLLFRLNLAAIPVAWKPEEMLADRYHFVQLGSTRQLVVKAAPQVPEEKSALIYGGVIYDPASDSMLIDTAATSLLVSRSRGELDFSTTDSTLRGGSWAFLNWTEKESKAVQSSLSAGGFQAVLQSGLQATEEHFKSVGDPGKRAVSPRIIHLATHGYFFPDPRREVRGERLRSEGDEPVFKVSDQPMIRSGLILAGGNHAWKTGKPQRPDMEDGILTAYEISQMDLSGTELVVLSACETGLGDIDGNEGVYGLQRAFKIAGAKYLIMSLWQVPDQQTQELMAAFYEQWLQNKMSIPDAFRAAQQAVRWRYEHPFFWAGFVLVE